MGEIAHDIRGGKMGSKHGLIWKSNDALALYLGKSNTNLSLNCWRERFVLVEGGNVVAVQRKFANSADADLSCCHFILWLRFQAVSQPKRRSNLVWAGASHLTWSLQ